MESIEQEVRDILERMGIADTQSLTAGDLMELANVLNSLKGKDAELAELRQCCNLLADALPHIECTSQKQSDLITAIGLYLEAADKEGGANHD